MKKSSYAVLAVLLTLSMLLMLPRQSFAISADLACQIVADQKKVPSGGKISYHILYHNVQNNIMSKAWIKVKVPNGLTLDETSDFEWNDLNSTITWNLKDMPGNGADVIHFNLKVKADQKQESNMAYEVSCQTGTVATVLYESGKTKVELGTEVHQPFYHGYPDGNFHPKAYQTRAETAATLVRILNLAETGKDVSFSDTPETYWAYDYIRKVAAHGYMVGDNGKFRPDEKITRAEFVSLLLRVRGIESVPLVTFDDSKNHWAKDAIATAKGLKYIDGIDKGHFFPDEPVERQVAAKMMSLALQRGALMDGETKVIQHYPDVTLNLWSFPWVEEASKVAHEAEQTGIVEHLIRYLPEQTEPF
ncbi:S-layer homology domain-containing protein [Paenibacillus sp. Soil522]|uniref:S-layer homology domain-containing protein n=1 Tax=Paenibacillus sp. Soil522 TaxID=1736388 RepID=UPI0006F1C73B|nr:S-layer homology domain-containing protein [Paenibacillus sp. Soil522]KRE47415.1 hypothetical protein ASG81_08915 [Paenibacillus sp. Soil522]